jgi:UDP-glucose 4-epimerase
MAKIAITGAGGFIGAYLTRRLGRDGHRVLAIDNYLRGRRSRLHSAPGEIEQIDLDVRDKEGLTRVLGGVDVMFHLAAVNGTENFYLQPALVLDVGVRGALAVCEACIEAGVPNLIVASSAEVYQTPAQVPTPETIEMIIPDPLNPRYSYGGSKLVSELIAFNYCRDKLDKVQVFRPHNIYGPDMGWKHVIPQLVAKIHQAAIAGERQVELQGSGEETRAFCFVDDLVEGLLTMWHRGETMNVYHIGTDEEVSIRALAALIAEASGVDVQTRPGPPAAGGTMRRCPDIAKLRTLGYQPTVSLAEGVARTVAWYLAHPRPVDSNELL